MTKLAETAPQNERMDAITTFDHYDDDHGDVDDDVVEDDAEDEDDDDKGDNIMFGNHWLTTSKSREQN